MTVHKERYTAGLRTKRHFSSFGSRTAILRHAGRQHLHDPAPPSPLVMDIFGGRLLLFVVFLPAWHRSRRRTPNRMVRISMDGKKGHQMRLSRSPPLYVGRPQRNGPQYFSCKREDKLLVRKQTFLAADALGRSRAPFAPTLAALLRQPGSLCSSPPACTEEAQRNCADRKWA